MMQRCVLFLLLPSLAQADGLTVFGHKVPDTDAVTSALVYAWELNARGIPATAYRLGGLNPETAYVLKSVGVEAPPVLEKLLPGTDVAVVDTNNPAELPDGIEKATVHSIVDHHKLIGGLKSPGPLEVDMRPLCSATSILYARAKAAGLTPPKHIAGLMLSGILSDSLEFRSPTTTAIDRQHAEELSKIAGLDVHSHAEAMLEAKADIGHFTADELLVMDSKVFTIGGKKLRISVLETTKPAIPLAKKTELLEAMKKRVANDVEGVHEDLDDVLLFVVDILKESSTVLISSPSAAKIVEHAWKVKVGSETSVVLPGVMSRKKQMIPALEAGAAKEGEL